ncbi:MAG: tRNA (N(6)-L-threonylcarbamoyladenosine(37)-C(2))-methylthiotransferase MtaB [Thermaerobacter sp.]|nr:tRNA (N(6)-L-threonylcarbamoyladenosine(37)-C(2))-methylthiotransferase MtaB [Thermaerobacter sp.]
MGGGGPVTPRVAFHTLGCKVNQYDTQAMAGLFRQAGYRVVPFGTPAEVAVINSCTVTGRAAGKSRQAVQRARRALPEAVVALVGCLPQAGGTAAVPEGVSVVVGTGSRGRIVELVEQARQRGGGPLVCLAPGEDFEELPLEEFAGRTRAFLKVQEGCAEGCTYCLVMAARGRPRSRRPEQAVEEARRLAAAGCREVVLTGTHLGSYGRDLGGSLAQLLRQVHGVDGLWRLRLSSLEPGEVTPELLAVTGELPKVCPHLHVPLQSGSARVLAAMGRRYTPAEYLAVLERVRGLKGAAWTTDCIVGFPGETEEDFRATCRLVEEAGFARLHVFPFSPRPGTLAAQLPGQVHPAVIRERAARLSEVGRGLVQRFAVAHRGLEAEVLVEEEREGGLLAGFTPGYLRVRFPGPDELKRRLVRVRITGGAAGAARGEIQVDGM